jgi:hypothetical protein
LQELTGNYSTKELGKLAMKMFFHTESWEDQCDDEQESVPEIMYILGACLLIDPPSDTLKHLDKSLRKLLTRLDELWREHHYQDAPPLTGEYPLMSDCLALLVEMPRSSRVLSLMKEILECNLVEGLSVAGLIRNNRRDPHVDAVREFYHLMASLLNENNMFDKSTFIKTVGFFPGLLRSATESRQDGLVAKLTQEGTNPEYKQVFLAYCNQYAYDITADLSKAGDWNIRDHGTFSGSGFLMRAAEIFESNELGKLVHDVYSYYFEPGPESVVMHLAMATDTEPLSKQTYNNLVNRLRGFKPTTLKRLLPVAPHSRRILCEALGWNDVYPLIDEIMRVSRMDEQEFNYSAGIRSSPDATYGVIDARLIRTILESLDKKRVREVFKLFRQAKVGVNNAIKLVESAAGWTKSWIEKSLPRRNQLAVRAYGLAPLEKSHDEVKERYLFFKKFEADSKQYGMLRQGSERGAARAGLANLATNAGYPDVIRLEWAMQADVAETSAPLGRKWTLDDYDIELTIVGGKPQLIINKGAGTLKTVPKDVRKCAEYSEMKEAKKILRTQASQFRKTFEQMMSTEDPLNRKEIGTLVKLPVARFILSQLILRNEGGELGLFDPDSCSLMGLKGDRIPLTNETIIAHSYHIFRSGTLAEWQREIVHRRIVQPFKQAFRELYLITPAERETRIFSNRFAGLILESRVAGSVFHVRAWLLEGEYPVPTKPFPTKGLEACFVFPDAGHILAEEPIITSDQIYFLPRPYLPEHRNSPDEGQIPLEEIDPIIFSEVMRDADLVVSVAQRGEGGLLSDEAYERRGELVTALIEDLDLPRVKIDGHFAKVKGKLAKYRVHLGTARIHIEPGNHLCVVPVTWGKRHPKLFLPFAHEDDPKVSEIISKVLLLTFDDQIKDKSILNQIRTRVR